MTDEKKSDRELWSRKGDKENDIRGTFIDENYSLKT